MAGQLTDRYVEAKRIAMAAMDVDASARDGLIDEQVGDDAELEREVRWMLEAIERTHTATLPFLPAEAAPDLSGHQAQATAPRNYRILRLLGEGGMGMVYLAERCDEGFSQQVALKFLHAAAEGSPILHERFSQERRLLARLEHPGIARLLDGGVMDSGRPFLAMEYVEGLRIDEWCDSHSLSLSERILLFLKVCDAVEFAHRNLVIHRDIKPANILVTADGMPKLLDFGIARLIEDGGQTLATATAAHALTLAYASPEQIEQQPLTTAADVYSLGVVLYQLVAGRRPYQHLVTPHLLSNAIIGGQVLAPSRSLREAPADGRRPWRSIPADVDAIVLKALRRQVSQRYASVAEFAQDLRNYLAWRPVKARRGRQWYRLRRFAQRNRWPLAAAGMVLLAVLAGLAASLLALAQTHAAQRLAEQRQHDLERMVAFQQSMLESVDIEAMGHALATAQQSRLPQPQAAGVPAAGPQASGSGGGMANADTARTVLDTYVIGHALDRLDHDFADSPLLEADMRQSLARALVTIGSYGHAVAQMTKVLQTRERYLPPGDEGLLSGKVDLARALEQMGETAKAAGVYEQAGAVASRLAPAAKLRVAVEAGAARMLAARGHLAEALAKQQQLVAGLRPALPPTDPGLMRLRRDMADTLVQLGRYDQALPEMQSLVALDRKVLGEESPETLDATMTLAKLLRQQGRFERSLALARMVTDIRERRLGADHPDTLEARYLVAVNETKLANDPAAFARARADIEHVIALRSAVFGKDNPQTVSAMTGLVALLAKMGNSAATEAQAQAFFGDAVKLERVIVESHERMLGSEHPNTLLAHGSLAGVLDSAGQYREALKEAKYTLAMQRKVLGEDHPIVSATLNLIGDISSDAGDLPTARQAYTDALAARDRLMGPVAPHTIESASRLYDVLMQQGARQDALRVRQRYLDKVMAMDPATLDASMRSVRDEAMRIVGVP
jgi:serine/threonine-protein kinase